MNKSPEKMLALIASLKLTVLLFVLSMILIFVGTVAQKDIGNWEVVNTYFRSLWLMMPIGIAGIKIPFVGGYTIGGLMVINLIAAHIVRFKFSAKRIGIILTHIGLVMLILGEVLTGLFAVEWQMRINEGQTVNYAVDIREAELAIVDQSPGSHDDVVVVPQAMLQRLANGLSLSDPNLPFDVQVLTWMSNSSLVGPRNAPPNGRTNPADSGIGRTIRVASEPPGTVVSGGGPDAPSAYIRLSKDGQDLGTWLVSTNFVLISNEARQAVTIDDKTYLIELRYVRDYKPYTITLIDFTHDKFVGTEIPKNFASEVQLKDPTTGEDRPAKIYMNHPLRHRPLNSRGETLYQSGYAGETTTILQVVRNPSWYVPYVACAIVSLGLVIHFGFILIKFVERTRR